MSEIIDDSAVYPAANPASGKDARALEVEVKFYVTDLDATRRRILDAGAILASPRVYERNVRFDTPDEALLRRQELLRLRQDTRVRLTFKGPTADDAHSEAKVREEIELEVADFDGMAVILARLGFAPVQVYEKYRETYHLEDVEIVVDELPFGNFVELEGTEQGIKMAARLIGFHWERRVLANYLALMELCRRTYDLPFADLTFDNFRARPVDMGALLPVGDPAREDEP